MLIQSKWIKKHPQWFATLRIDIEERHSGWDPLINEALQVAEQILSECSYEYFSIVQIKEKLGELRIYFREKGGPIEALERLKTAMVKVTERSLHVCEVCGATASLGLHGSQACVRCESCAPHGWQTVEVQRS